MLKADTSTKQGRQELVDFASHESYLEGHDLTPELQQLLKQFVNGTLSLEEVLKARMEGSKVA